MFFFFINTKLHMSYYYKMWAELQGFAFKKKKKTAQHDLFLQSDHFHTPIKNM